MWRPEDWEHYKKEQVSFADMTRSIASGFSSEDFEAGADAMLRVIAKYATNVRMSGLEGKGVWVFLPKGATDV